MLYHLTTFGCQMNEHDSERIRGVLEAEGWQEAETPDEADLLVFNTCAVRESAESRLLGRLGEARRLKSIKPGRLVALGGCFAQARKDGIFRQLPFLDIAFGPADIARLPDLVGEAADSEAHASSFDGTAAPVSSLPSRRGSRTRAWVQAMTGCTNCCSYCIVPRVRGPERSRIPSDIEGEVRELVDDGVTEITILGQNVNAYGNDLAGEGKPSFAALLERLDAIAGLKRIRFTTSHPKDLGPDLIEAMRDLPSVCEHMHLPAQSGSTRILERMKRRYTRERYLELADRLRQEVGGVALTTDLIVGFPGEREDDFYRTMTLVERCRFDGAFTFVFSPRPGTEAARLPGTVPRGTVRRRMKELVELSQAKALENNQALSGREMEVMVEGPSRLAGGQLRGRTRSNKIVNFRPDGAGPSLVEGALVSVLIESVTSTTLKGRQVAAGGP
jgi:tRNA-2-methylthio-N6-dimethylallyladenosine synthase